MFNMGWTELLVIGVVALIVIGPKDLPEMFRQLGRFTGKIRAMGREFQRAMDQAAKESGVNDVAKDLKTATSSKALGLDAVKDAADRFEKWDPLKQSKPSTKPFPSAAKPEVAKTDAPAAAPDTAGPAAVTDKPKHGAATQALAEKQAARKAVIAETNAKLKAIDEGAASAQAVPAEKPAEKLAAKPAAKPRAKAPAKPKAAADTTASADKPAPKPRAPRKKKADEA